MPNLPLKDTAFCLHGVHDRPKHGSLLTHRNLISTDKFVHFIKKVSTCFKVVNPTQYIDEYSTQKNKPNAVIIVDDGLITSHKIVDIMLNMGLCVSLAVNPGVLLHSNIHWFSKLDISISKSQHPSSYKSMLTLRREIKKQIIESECKSIAEINRHIEYIQDNPIPVDEIISKHPEVALLDVSYLASLPNEVSILNHGNHHLPCTQQATNKVEYQSAIDSFNQLGISKFMRSVWIPPNGTTPLTPPFKPRADVKAIFLASTEDDNPTYGIWGRVPIWRGSKWLID